MMTRAITVYGQGLEFVGRLQARLTREGIPAEIRISHFGRQVEIWGAPRDAAKISALTIMSQTISEKCY